MNKSPRANKVVTTSTYLARRERDIASTTHSNVETGGVVHLKRLAAVEWSAFWPTSFLVLLAVVEELSDEKDFQGQGLSRLSARTGI
jgi:hypothetical protein